MFSVSPARLLDWAEAVARTGGLSNRSPIGVPEGLGAASNPGALLCRDRLFPASSCGVATATALVRLLEGDERCFLLDAGAADLLVDASLPLSRLHAMVWLESAQCS